MKKQVRILAALLALLLLAGCSDLEKAAKALDKDDYEALARIFEKASTLEERDEIIGEAEAKLEGLINQYNTNQITYEAASAAVDSMESTQIVSSREIAFVRDELQDLQWSKQAFQTATDYYNQGKYLDAMEFFSMVSPFDTLSNQADENYAQAQKQYAAACKQQAEAAAAQKDYDTAIQILTACGNNISGSDAEEIQVLIRKYEADGIGESIAKALEEANALKGSGNYAGTYGLLQRASTQYPNRVEIESALSACQREYIDNAIQRAQSLFDTSKDYNGAISILSLAMGDFPENPQLQAAIDKYAAYRPVELKELESFFDEKIKIHYYEDKIEDNCGNEYNGFYSLLYGSSGKTVYLLNGKYDRIEGVVFIWKNSKNYNNGSLQFFGDGKLLFDSQELIPGTKPISFNVSVSGVSEFEVCYTGGDSHDWTVETPTMANVWLSKDVNK